MDGVFLCSDDASLKTRLTNSLERYGEKLNIAFHSRALRKGMKKQLPSVPYLNTGCSDNGFVGHEAMFVYVAVACSCWSCLSVLQQSLAEFSGLAVQSLEMLSCLGV